MNESSIHLLFFFFNDTATTEIYTLSLHDALPIWCHWWRPLRLRASRARRSWPIGRRSASRAAATSWSPCATRRSRTRRSEEHTSELQSPCNLVCRLLLEKKKNLSASFIPHALPNF